MDRLKIVVQKIKAGLSDRFLKAKVLSLALLQAGNFKIHLSLVHNLSDSYWSTLFAFFFFFPRIIH